MSNIHRADYDGRYSRSNKDWAKEIDLPEAAIQRAILNAHPILVEDFTTHVRKFYDDLGAERFALPGREESGTIVGGYEITRSVRFDDRRGFAIGHNPAAVSPYVCWQFTTENGQRDFYWGTYADEFKGAADNYTARVAVHLSGGDIKEVENPLAATEMSTEQNYNMVDGLRNNMATPKADLTDGQTYEEVAELAPETLPREKPSVLAQIREAKKAQKKPSPKKTREKNAPDLER